MITTNMDLISKRIFILLFILVSVFSCAGYAEKYYTSRGNTVLTRYNWLDSAMKNYNFALKYNDQFAPAYLGRGVVWLKKEKYEFAIQEFNKALEIDPQYADAYFNRATAWKEKGNLDQALSDCNIPFQVTSA